MLYQHMFLNFLKSGQSPKILKKIFKFLKNFEKIFKSWKPYKGTTSTKIFRFHIPPLRLLRRMFAPKQHTPFSSHANEFGGNTSIKTDKIYLQFSSLWQVFAQPRRVYFRFSFLGLCLAFATWRIISVIL